MNESQPQFTHPEISLAEAMFLGKEWDSSYFRQYQERHGLQTDGLDLEEGRLIIRSDVIFNLIFKPSFFERYLDNEGTLQLTHMGIRMSDAHIIGDVDLSAADVKFPLSFSNCRFKGGITINDAILKSFKIIDGDIQHVDGENLHVHGHMEISNTLVANYISLRVARIGGELNLNGSNLNPEGREFHKRYNSTLDADGIHVLSHVLLADGFRAHGFVNFRGAYIGQRFDCTGAYFQHLRDDPVLDCDSAEIGGGAFLRREFVAKGAIDFRGAVVKRRFDCTNGRFESEHGWAIRLLSCSVHGDLLMTDGFEVKGEVNLVRAKIDGNLNCSGGKIVSHSKVAIRCSSAQIGSDVTLTDGFKAVGQIRFIGARIGGQLACSDGARFENADGSALLVDNSVVGENVFLRRNASFKGNVRFIRALIGGSIHINQETEIEGNLSFGSTKSFGIADDPRCLPGNEFTIELNGFTYDRLTGNAPTDFPQRISWLLKQPSSDLGAEFKPQPWTQLAKVLKDMGHDRDARRILEERERRRPITGSFARRAVGSIWKQIVGHTTGHGYRPTRSLYWIFGVIVFGWLTFATILDLGLMRPREGSILARAPYDDPASPEEDRVLEAPIGYERVKPLLYSVDLFVPIVDLSQDRYWLPRDPDEREVTVETVKQAYPALPSWLHGPIAWVFDGWFPKAWYWIQISLGWILSTIAIAGFSGALKRD